MVFPFVTLTLGLTAALLSGLPEASRELLVFDQTAVLAGEWWRAFTGHLLHADNNHLRWNILALVLIGSLLEKHSRPLLLAATLAGSVAISLWLLSPWAGISRYCGLSGVLNTLLGVYLLHRWHQTHAKAIALTALLCSAKIALEMTTQTAMFSDITWPPYTMAHLVGWLAALPVWVGLWWLGAKRGTGSLGGDALPLKSECLPVRKPSLI